MSYIHLVRDIFAESNKDIFNRSTDSRKFYDDRCSTLPWATCLFISATGQILFQRLAYETKPNPSELLLLLLLLPPPPPLYKAQLSIGYDGHIQRSGSTVCRQMAQTGESIFSGYTCRSTTTLRYTTRRSARSVRIVCGTRKRNVESPLLQLKLQPAAPGSPKNKRENEGRKGTGETGS